MLWHLVFGGAARRKLSDSNGASGQATETHGASSHARQTQSAKEGAAGGGMSIIGRLILALLGLLRSASDGFRRLDDAMRDRYTERLLLRSDQFRRMLEKEAGAFGIDLHGPGAVDYYNILGIKYGSDQKEIKQAYKELAKKHHPDVSKDIDAVQIMQRINEAYATLNSERKQEYDSKAFPSGRKGVSPDDARRISDELLRRYMEAREKDFDKFRKATSGPMTADDLAAAIDEVCNWGRRFDRVAGATFRKFIKYGKSVRKLSAANRKLLGRTKDEKVLIRLRENAGKLDELSQAYEGVERSLSGIRKGLRREIGAQEAEVARKLRSSVKYV